MAVKRHRTHYDVTAENRTDAAMNAVERNMKKVDGAAAAMGRTFRTVLGATAAVAFARQMVREVIEAEKASNRLNAVLRATGGAIGVTRREMDAMAEGMERPGLFDADSVRQAAGELVKFGNIHGDVFRGAIELSGDLAAFMDSDIPAAAQIVGRALQSPTEGMRLLEQQFGKLTDEQEKHIESLAAQGRAVEAQNAVLDLLRSKIGGTADEMNTGITRATREFGFAWNGVVEAIGKTPAVQGAAAEGFGVLTNQLRAMKRVIEEGNWAELVFGSAIAGRKRSPMNVASGKIRPAGLDTAVALEASLSGVPAVPITLGGRTEDSKAKAAREAAAKAAAQFQEQLDVQAAFRSQQAADREAEFLGNLDKQLDAKVEILAIDEQTQRQAEQIAQRMQMAAEQEAKFTDPSKLEQMLEGLKTVNDAARDLGFTFASAFEDAVIEGQKLRDVMSGLAKDIARIVLRRAVTEPLAAAVTGAVSGFFGGARQEGGPVIGGRAYLVGEEGPELFVPGRSGGIVPNGTGGGVVINMPINFSANTPAAVRDAVMASVPMLVEAAKRGVFEARMRGAGA